MEIRKNNKEVITKVYYSLNESNAGEFRKEGVKQKAWKDLDVGIKAHRRRVTEKLVKLLTGF